jgi:hypothetical protein
MPRYNTIKKTIQEVACHNEYYMTNTFASNKYRESGVEHCNYKKSACVDMKGMKIYDNGSTMEDRKCYCVRRVTSLHEDCCFTELAL